MRFWCHSMPTRCVQPSTAQSISHSIPLANLELECSNIFTLIVPKVYEYVVEYVVAWYDNSPRCFSKCLESSVSQRVHHDSWVSRISSSCFPCFIIMFPRFSHGSHDFPWLCWACSPKLSHDYPIIIHIKPYKTILSHISVHHCFMVPEISPRFFFSQFPGFGPFFPRNIEVLVKSFSDYQALCAEAEASLGPLKEALEMWRKSGENLRNIIYKWRF